MAQALGRMLRETEQALVDPDNASRSYLEDRADTEARDFRLVQEFFDIAQIKLATAIFNREPPLTMGVQVGAKSRSAPAKNAHVETLLRLRHIEPNSELAASKPFGTLWKQFKSWAQSKGLEALWIQESDGVGDYSWYVLTVRPAR